LLYQLKKQTTTMKTSAKNTRKLRSSFCFLLSLLLFGIVSFSPPILFAQGTAFNYQGQLDVGGSPANGSYDLTFTLYDASADGDLIAGPLPNSATAVSNGFFTVTLDFGPGVFNGNTYWLELAVRTKGGGTLATLAPRQQVRPTPYSIYSENSGEASSVIGSKQHPGGLKLSTRAYDKTVAGIISGANGIHPGIALHQEGALEGGQNVALSGRVCVLADASNGAIEPGDLLTTSTLPGHAMKVTDFSRAQGAILGKAMSALANGSGMVPVLVSLQ
jgi:hypothetical protein